MGQVHPLTLGPWTSTGLWIIGYQASKKAMIQVKHSRTTSTLESLPKDEAKMKFLEFSKAILFAKRGNEPLTRQQKAKERHRIFNSRVSCWSLIYEIDSF